MKKARDFTLGDETIEPGERKTVRLKISYLADHTPMHLAAHVINGEKPGPTMFVSAAIHGDEVLGVEIIRRLIEMKRPDRLHGTLILVPVVNAYGFIANSRYLPDRRDLNRSFPGSARGALAGQLAHRFMKDIVAKCDYGIDLHTGAIHRSNLPQIRADLSSDTVHAMAEAFGAPIMLNSSLRDGSLRAEAQDVGCNILLYEAGEALRFEENAIRIGVRGVIAVMRHVGMLKDGKKADPASTPIRSDTSHWLRAPVGGVMRARVGLGDEVEKGQVLAEVSDPFGEDGAEVRAREDGVVIGRLNMPIVNRGDALFHIAEVHREANVEDHVDAVENAVENDPLFDGFEIV